MTHKHQIPSKDCNAFTVEKAITRELQDLAYAVRYRAYTSQAAIAENASQRFSDEYDPEPNTLTYLVSNSVGPIGSIRACIYAPQFENRPIPTFEIYRDEIVSAIGLDKTIVESNRFVIDPAFHTKIMPQLLLFRMITANAIVHNTDLEPTQWKYSPRIGRS